MIDFNNTQIKKWNNGFRFIFTDGSEIFVPEDENNVDYQAYKNWKRINKKSDPEEFELPILVVPVLSLEEKVNALFEGDASKIEALRQKERGGKKGGKV